MATSGQPTSGPSIPNVNTSASTPAERAKKQKEDLAGVGSQFWGIADNDYGYAVELSIDNPQTKTKAK
ncbi:hypothetical protein EKO27_g10638 [Xylaria grammica]|uniref:Uncharacterized protein n=1 Tax=Xylaria grammica TaxID=363999 RepID=A0A439CQM7_9PEZI|nr:hypothetical protein EKO27_g10638 [Xylaria grammica]